LEAANCEGDISDLCRLVAKQSRKSEHAGEEAELLISSRKRRKYKSSYGRMEDSVSCSKLERIPNEAIVSSGSLFQSKTLLVT
jgi:hypothetical protein